MADERKCSEYCIPAPGRFTGHRCGKRGKVERDGRWYCGQHDPVKVKERMDKRYAEVRDKWALDDARYKAKRRIEDATAAVVGSAIRLVRDGFENEPGNFVDLETCVAEYLAARDGK